MSDNLAKNPQVPNPVELLRDLIRFNTTNPPGNETECVGYIQETLSRFGIESTILARHPNRANLVARIEGRKDAPPLLLYGHVDVVTTDGQSWEYAPFGADIADGFVWGRGALDMKGGIAMMLSAFLRAKAERLNPAGDIVLAILADEEAAGDMGAKFLVESHPEIFEGICFALGEVGGATLHLDGQRFYPIQIAEKQLCWMKATLRGPGGHGARPMRGGAMARLGRFLTILDQNRLPLHVTPVTRQMIEEMTPALSPSFGADLQALMNVDQSDEAIYRLEETGKFFDPILHNTVNATVVQGGNKVNVIPSEITVEIDGRLLPGYDAQDMIDELRQITGDDFDLEIVRYDPTPANPDLTLYDMLGEILSEADPGGLPIPFLLPGVTDGRLFARLGIQTYGFTPMKLPANFKRLGLVHAANERVPVEAVEFGAHAIYSALQRYNL
jgi:acetylornithine deacetylase/succinyl-diaminopimelate desuccinylase-like protein